MVLSNVWVNMMKKNIYASSDYYYEKTIRMLDKLSKDISDINIQVNVIGNYYYYCDSEDQKKLLEEANWCARFLEDVADKLYDFANITKNMYVKKIK